MHKKLLLLARWPAEGMTMLATTNEQTQVSASALENLLIGGNLSQLSTRDRTAYYLKVCDTLGLNPLTKPFEYLALNGKLQLYATRNCTDQLRNLHKVSTRITGREQVGDVYIVTAQATLPDGRCDESVGVVALGNLKGEALANAIMKAETKAKRRVTLSICGLSMMDETEVETVPGALPAPDGDVPAQPRERQRERRSEPPPADDNGATFRFGKLKDAPLTSASLKDLQWYGTAVRKSVDDPAKSRFREQNEAHLREVEAAYRTVAAREKQLEQEAARDGNDDWGMPPDESGEAEAEAQAGQWDT